MGRAARLGKYLKVLINCSAICHMTSVLLGVAMQDYSYSLETRPQTQGLGLLLLTHYQNGMYN